MLNSAKRDRIFSSMRFPKASSFASIASSNVIVYASRSVILRSFFYCQMKVRKIDFRFGMDGSKGRCLGKESWLIRSEDDAIGNSLGVCRDLAEGITSLPGWHKGVRWKKNKTRRKIIGGSRKGCRELKRS
ncbi:hypothetical protein BHE74_00043165 [Ensete ventricosum]|nr:hypothetical protein GW17_00054704 [Ensete ventricosum]RWW50554.1 hypothetical protein BHE74_00043165 [Ensete ventricosum]RZS15766.1 hypothetical protein BHM03_00047642 [Ensete ventricosum]